MRRSWRPTRRIVEVDTYGPEPVGKAGAAMLELETHANLDGRQGYTHFGMKGEANMTYSGPVQSPQTFVGAAQMGANPSVHVQEYPALPAESPPQALPTWIQDWTNLEGLVP